MKEEDENSINSEILESEEKSVSDKIKKQADFGSNIILNATFTRSMIKGSGEYFDDNQSKNLDFTLNNGKHYLCNIR
jgi:hypothetical protein